MNLTTFGAVCPVCQNRYGPPHPRGAEIRICLPCLKETETASAAKKRNFGSNLSSPVERMIMRKRQNEEQTP